MKRSRIETKEKREPKKEKKQRSVTIVFDPNNIILNWD